MSFLDDVYSRSPVLVQQALVQTYGLAWYLRRHGRGYRAKVGELSARDRWPAEKFEPLRLSLLNALLDRARHAPYYAKLFQESGIQLPLSRVQGLQALPTLSKHTLRTAPRDLLTGRPPLRTKVFRSSGTTGTPTEIYYTRPFHQSMAAYYEARVRRWANVPSRARRAMFGVRKVCRFDQDMPPFWRRSSAERLTYYSIYHLSPRFLSHYLDDLERFAPKIVMGYPSALNLVARFALESGRRIDVGVAVTTSETVTDDTRSAIEEAFCCTLYDQYGAVEGTHFVAQCEHGRYHLSPESGIVEILDDEDRECAPGVEGRVVVTGLENILQPLVRYEIGDVAAWARDQRCPCGRNMPILERIAGRYEDYCVTPDGRRILRFDTVFKGVATLVEAQVVQDAIDRFTIRVVPTPGFGHKDEERLRENFREHAGDVALEIERVDAIERTVAGKFRAVVNRMHEQ